MKFSRRIAWLFVSFLFISALAVPPSILAQGRFVPRHLGPALAAQERYTRDLLRIEGVAGTAVGIWDNGEPVVKIYTEREGIGGIPRVLDGVSVVVQVTGKIQPVAPPPGKGGGHRNGGVDPKSEFPQPVPLGVSSGNNQVEIVGLFITCSSGTLGARLKSNGGSYYILSNNHVYARTNSSGNTDKIVQPGLADTNCSSSGNIIGDNIQYVPIKFLQDEANSTNIVDTAVASTTTAQVANQFWDGATIPGQNAYALTADDIGNLGVKKFGASSGLTIGRVTGWNATFLVSYGTNETAQFTHQIEFSGCKGPCIKGGDSGSVLIRSDDFRPVGLLFAGDNSGKTAWANPMTDPDTGVKGVLSELETLLRASSLSFQ
jgi:hypothetical protein